MQRRHRISLMVSGVALAAALTVSGARADDMAMWGMNWTGPYVGVNAGLDLGDFSGAQIFEGGFTGAAGAVGPSTLPIHRDTDGFTGGGQAGYNWEFPGNWLVGAEGDLDGSTLGRRTTVTADFGSPGGTPLAFVPGDSFRVSSDWNGSVRGRVGYAWNRFMVYGTAGVAFADVRMTQSFVALAGSSATSGAQSNILVGPTAGAGFEYAVVPNVSIGAEYRFSDYGRDTFNLGVTNICNTCGAGGTPINAAASGRTGLETNAFLFKINFHFAAPPPPPPTPVAAPVPPPPPPPKARVFLVYFDFDRYDLTKEGRLVIEEAAKTFHEGGYARIELTGYTDLAGTQEYNLRLSQRRANTVADAMARLNVPRQAMNVRWRGKENPRVATPDGVRDPDNRRVEIVMP